MRRKRLKCPWRATFALLIATIVTGCIGATDETVSEGPGQWPSPSGVEGEESAFGVIERDVRFVVGVNATPTNSVDFPEEWPYWTWFDVLGDEVQSVHFTLSWDATFSTSEEMAVEVHSHQELVTTVRGASPLTFTLELTPQEYGFYPRHAASEDVWFDQRIHYEIVGPVRQTTPAP